MKYRFLLLALCCSLFMPACKKSGNPAPDDNKRIKEQILGTWLLTSETTTYYDKAGKEAKSETTARGENNFFEFFPDNVVKVTNLNDDISYQYFINPVNGKQQIELKDDNHEEYYDISINGDILSFSVEQKAEDDDPLYSKSVHVYSLKKQ